MSFLVWASADIGSNIYLKSVCKKFCKERVIALTFDDGPDELMTPKVLDLLLKYNIKATFFLIGSKVDKNPDLVKRIFNEGHIVANHTYSHSGIFPLSNAKYVKNEIEKCRNSIKTIVGETPILFRPPFGVTNPIIGRVVNSLGLKTIGWSIRSLDTLNVPEKISSRVLRLLHPGAIILLHDRCVNIDIVLDNLINEIHKRKYSFITLEQILNHDAYEN